MSSSSFNIGPSGMRNVQGQTFDTSSRDTEKEKSGSVDSESSKRRKFLPDCSHLLEKIEDVVIAATGFMAHGANDKAVENRDNLVILDKEVTDFEEFAMQMKRDSNVNKLKEDICKKHNRYELLATLSFAITIAVVLGAPTAALVGLTTFSQAANIVAGDLILGSMLTIHAKNQSEINSF
jgi:hypothetical protein